ncbi:Sec translocon accessory complex subunit YajC [Neobacillus rhizosphaerae]|uniref:Sec translocon accessory complex subunit YajC n=1 Tax=Neobacillus rhizosphaerae TaxID=2880965 RepID=A0ABM9EU93_9BACI|nr:preprotein translocase subunit YajC [Neobacillus rhizosphaerae]CAH2716235.1 Sec translocon accessory complex subunit YajC [Neobacillus rhizosphaerae]
MQGTMGTIIPLILMFVLFYFLLIRPQQKRQKAVQQMQRDLKKGDKVVTIGGLHGFVDSIDDSKAVIKCGDGSRLTFDRSAIREVTEGSGESVNLSK